MKHLGERRPLALRFLDFALWQSGISTYFMSRDRGQNIRTEQQWKDLASRIFPLVSTNIVTGANRLAYVGIIGQCCKLVRPAARVHGGDGSQRAADGNWHGRMEERLGRPSAD